MIKLITSIRRCGKSYLLNHLFYYNLLEAKDDADYVVRFAFDSANDLYLIWESLYQIEKGKCGVDPEKFLSYTRSKVIDNGMCYFLPDEVQMLDCFETVLNGYPHQENMDIFAAENNVKFHERNHIQNIRELEALLNILSSGIGPLTDPKKLRNTFRTVKSPESPPIP